MIISPDQVHWFLFDKKLDEKVFLKFAKSKVKVSDSLRKNIGNVVNQKHQPSPTTQHGIKELFKSVVPSHSSLIGGIDLQAEIKLHTNEAMLNYIEEQYDGFLNRDQLNHNFIDNEVTAIINALGASAFSDHESTVIDQSENLTVEIGLVEFDFSHDYFLDISSTGAIGFKAFSLSIAVYLMFCFELSLYQPKSGTYANFNDGILELISNDPLRAKRMPFWYYTELWNRHLETPFEQMSEKLGMDLRTFNYYRTGDRKIVNKKHLKAIWDHDGYYYCAAAFIKKLSDLMPEEDHMFLKNAFKCYSHSAKERYRSWLRQT